MEEIKNENIPETEAAEKEVSESKEKKPKGKEKELLKKIEELEAAAKLLDSYDTEYYTCHCTGKEQYEYMKKYMKRLNYFSAGEIMNI